MHIYKEKEALKKLINTFKNKELTIGFVPTMGALHQGHLSLVQHALDACDKVVISIFVNPTQFDNVSDLDKYPRSVENDIALLSKITDEAIVFIPAPSEIYGDTVVSEEFSFDGLEDEMEGKFRKGHFNGVATVVKKLFEIVAPDKAFFGEKDYQQFKIIKKLAEKLQLKTEVLGCPTNREASGLARSSRNERLNPKARENAAFIYQILQQVKEDFGTKSASDIKQWVKNKFDQSPGLDLEYFEIADAESLKPITEAQKGKEYRAFIAAFSDEIRLIDNIALN